MTDFSTLLYTSLVKSLRTLSYTCGLWKEPLWAGLSNIGRYKGYPRGFMAVLDDLLYEAPDVPWQLKGWSQGYCHAELLKSVHKVLHGNTVYNLPFPYGEGGGGRLHTRYTENCEWWWYSRWPVVSPTSRYFRLRPLKSFTFLNVRSFRSHVISRFANDFLDFLSWLTDITITECDQNVGETA